MTRLLLFIFFIVVLGMLQIPIALVVFKYRAIPFGWQDLFLDGAFFLFATSMFGSAAYSHYTRATDNQGVYYLIQIFCLCASIAGAFIYGLHLSDSVLAQKPLHFAAQWHVYQIVSAASSLAYYLIVEFVMNPSRPKDHTVILFPRTND